MKPYVTLDLVITVSLLVWKLTFSILWVMHDVHQTEPASTALLLTQRIICTLCKPARLYIIGLILQIGLLAAILGLILPVWLGRASAAPLLPLLLCWTLAINVMTEVSGKIIALLPCIKFRGLVCKASVVIYTGLAVATVLSTTACLPLWTSSWYCTLPCICLAIVLYIGTRLWIITLIRLCRSRPGSDVEKQRHNNESSSAGRSLADLKHLSWIWDGVCVLTTIALVITGYVLCYRSHRVTETQLLMILITGTSFPDSMNLIRITRAPRNANSCRQKFSRCWRRTCQDLKHRLPCWLRVPNVTIPYRTFASLDNLSPTLAPEVNDLEHLRQKPPPCRVRSDDRVYSTQVPGQSYAIGQASHSSGEVEK